MGNNPTIFIVEDEEKMREILRINLSKRYSIILFADAEGAYNKLHGIQPEIIVSDVRLPGMDGIEFMQKVHKRYPAIPFIIFTGYGSIDHAVETMKKGAFDYLVKPIKIENLIQSIERARSYLDVFNSDVTAEEAYSVTINEVALEFVTRDPLTIQMLNLSKKAAKFNAPILIIGETGTGKELIARYIHKSSERKGPFVKINCASIPKDILEGELFGYKKGAFTGADHDYEGKIVLSNRGTLFLDEIGELPLDLQAKLLHVLEIPEFYPLGSNAKKEVDLNLLTATNRNLRTMIETGGFRRDLYYRIAVIPIKIPPLRERRCDILPLVEYFILRRDTKIILSPQAKLRLLEYSWPGNVRELKNVIERSLLLMDHGTVISDVIFDSENYKEEKVADIPVSDDIPATWDVFKQYKSKIMQEKKVELEKIFIEKLLIKNNGNISMSARESGIDRRQLQDMIKDLKIDVSIFRTN